MTDYVIVTDSSANLTNELIDSYGVRVLSLVYIMDGKEYLSYEKGVEPALKSVYEKMREKTPVSTSCINADVCYAEFTKVLDEGKDLYYLGFSSGLSNSFDVAKTVLEDLKTKYPDRKILYTDSLNASLGQGLMVIYAVRKKQEGYTIEQLCDWMNENKLMFCQLFTVDSLSYLYRGGRLKKSSYVLASTLNIKPVMHMDLQGKLTSIGKVFGRKKALSNLVERMKTSIVDPEQQTICISHGDCISDVEYLIAKINETVKVKEIIVNYVDLVIGAHSGPGTVALFFFGKERLAGGAK